GGATLGDTYQKLTGKPGTQGFSEFISLLNGVAQGGALNLPASGNPFPIGAPAQPDPPTIPTNPDQPQLPTLSTGGGMLQGILIGAIVLVIALIALVSAYAFGWIAF